MRDAHPRMRDERCTSQDEGCAHPGHHSNRIGDMGMTYWDLGCDMRSVIHVPGSLMFGWTTQFIG